MSKLEYDTISCLLKEQDIYIEVLRGFSEYHTHYIVSNHCDVNRSTQYKLNCDDEEFFITYFEAKLDIINEKLKELGYYD